MFEQQDNFGRCSLEISDLSFKYICTLFITEIKLNLFKISRIIKKGSCGNVTDMASMTKTIIR